MRFTAGIPAIDSYPLPAGDDLPANAADWTVDPDRAVLLVHDMQRYFLRPLPSPGLRDQVIANAAALRDACAAHGVPVAYTAQPGGMSQQQRGLLQEFWGPGMRVDPADRQVVDPLAPASEDWLFTKWRYSAFFRSGLLDRMRAAGRDQLVVCGVYGHVGVLMTAVEAHANDIQVFMAADAIADFSREHHLLALSYAAGRCAVVSPVAELTAQIAAARGTVRELAAWGAAV